MVSAPSLSDLVSSYSCARSMSETEPRPSQRGHMPPVMLKLRRSFVVLPPFSKVTAPAPLIEATLKENACGGPTCGWPSRLNRMRSIALASVAVPTVERVDVGPGQRRHEALHEGAVSLVDQPLRLRGDRAEHQRALARPGHAGEHRQPALRDLDADVLQVVHPRAVHADQIVAVSLHKRLLVLHQAEDVAI